LGEARKISKRWPAPSTSGCAAEKLLPPSVDRAIEIDPL
jgi:hypothetical protein